MQKNELYKWIKIAGMLSFIPFILVAGAATGYFAGDYLQRRLILPAFIMPVCIATGMLASIIEAVRIIKLTVKIDKKN